tara:strand:- start:7317 stop:7463 length:147 start_codon:yes stop_codon:yes gene_type:complete
MKHYWKCPKCNIDDQDANDLYHAKELLEEHEKEAHKKKSTGMFGWKKL